MKMKLVAAVMAMALGLAAMAYLAWPNATIAADEENGRLPPLAEMLSDRAVGLESAPIKLLVFFSFSCKYCATFNLEVLPALIDEFAAPGHVQIIFKDFPLNDKAMKAAALARCAPPRHYRALTDSLFSEFDKWTASGDAESSLSPYGRLAGLTGVQIGNCFEDTTLAEELKKRRQAYLEQYHIESTPTLILISHGVPAKIPGAPSYGNISEAIKDKLKAFHE